MLGKVTGRHRFLCWCDLQYIEVEEDVPLSCPVCLGEAKLFYRDWGKFVREDKNKMDLTFDDYLNMIYDGEFQKIKTSYNKMKCSLAENEQVKCREKLDILYEKFKAQCWTV